MATSDQQLGTLIGINAQLQRNTEQTKALAKLNDTIGLSLDKILRSSSRYATSVEEIVELQARGITNAKQREKLEEKLKDLQVDVVVLRGKEAEAMSKLTIAQKKDLETLRYKIDAQKVVQAQQERLNKFLSSATLTKAQKLQLDRISTQTTKREADLVEEIEKIAKNSANVLKPLELAQQAQLLESVIKEATIAKEKLSLYKKLKNLAADYYKENLSGTKGLLLATTAIAAAGFTLKKGFEIVKDVFFATDAAAVNISESSGTTAEYSRNIIQSYRKIQEGTTAVLNNLNVSLATNKNLLAAQKELQASVEASAMFTQSSVESQVYLTKQLNLSAEEAAKLNELSLITGKTTEDTTSEIYKQTALANDQNKVRLRGTTILKEVAKIEGVLAVNYGNNVSRIAAAVAQTKALGTNLQTAANASRSLLDFESSIENELEAELLTGRKFNLEKARSLALDGDSAGAVKEMLKNVGSLSDFQKQNVLAKEAEAKAIGMTVDELSNALRQQQLLKGLSKEDAQAREEILATIENSADRDKYRATINAATNAQQLRAAEEAITKQEKFNAVIDKLRDKIGEIGEGPLLKLLNGFESVIENAQRFSGLLKTIAVTMTAIAVASTIASFGANLAAAGIALGGTAIAGGVVAGASSYALMNDGVVDPSGGIVLQTPKGQIKTNKDDYLIATTDPASLLGGGGSGKTDQILSAILSAVSKPSGVYIDSYRAGTALGMSNSAFA